MDATTTEIQPAIVPLDWECKNFGFSVGQLAAPAVSPDRLDAVLSEARKNGVRLVVWPTVPETSVPDRLLAEYGGRLVDRKATFSTTLASLAASDAPYRSRRFEVVPYTANAVSPPLASLAIAAGIYSRFRTDPKFPFRKFEAMYRVWIERSVNGQLADVVLVVPVSLLGLSTNDLGGMVTIKQTHDKASIGLIAVASNMQGQGIGSLLLEAAHRWMVERRLRTAQVVTQLDNLPACRLYSRSGYQLIRVQPYYHFWL